MKTTNKIVLLGLLAATASGCAAPNKTLVGQTFIGEDRSIKILMTHDKGDASDPIIDQYIRVCTLRDGKEVDCKDTLILENVRPGSLY